jgi:Fic family protein
MDTNGNIPELERLLTDLDQIEAEIEREVARLRTQLELATARQRMIRAMKRAAMPTQKPGPKAEKKRKGKNISDQRLDEILLAITSYSRTVKETFTARDIIDFTEVSQPTVNLALNKLRERGELRKVGVDDTKYKRDLYSLDES